MSRSKLALFSALRALRHFEKRHLPALQSVEDCDLVREIGYRQAARRPIMLKELMLLGIGSVPTVQRRLRRLRALGVVVQRRCKHDHRAVEVLLAPKVVRTIAGCEELLRPAGKVGASYRSAALAPEPSRARKTAGRHTGTAPERDSDAQAPRDEPQDR